MNAMLRIQNLQVEKADKTICHVPELDVARGERLAVIGPNGSGKTTLLRVASGLEREFTGLCHIGAPTRSRVFVHQAPYLFRGSVLFNTTYGLAARGIARRQQISIAREWLAALGVEHLVGRQCSTLSGGERRRVALARAFALEADLLLLDEPFADLDEDGIAVVCRAIATVSRSTILIASPVALPVELNVRSYTVGPDDRELK